MSRAVPASVPPSVPGPVAPDGSPVEVFDRLPPGRAPEYVAAATPPGGHILDLGCGAGRLSRALAAAGYRVVAVDVSPEMLARAGRGMNDGPEGGVAAGGVGLGHRAGPEGGVAAGRGSPEVVLGDAATVDLGREFDTVVLASYLVNDPALAPAFLTTCRRHVSAAGAVVVQRYDPVWARCGRCGATTSGDVTIQVDRLHVDGQDLDLGVAYCVEGRTWRQDISARLVDDDDLERLAGRAGLVVHGWLDEFRSWAVLRRR